MQHNKRQQTTDGDRIRHAIKAEEELSVAASKNDVYGHKDEDWVPEAKMSASLRDTDEADCYGFVLPSPNDA